MEAYTELAFDASVNELPSAKDSVPLKDSPRIAVNSRSLEPVAIHAASSSSMDMTPDPT